MANENETKPETALAIREPVQAIELGTLRASSPRALVTAATDVAKCLSDVIRQGGLSCKISGREYVRCEGWTTLAAILGVVPREVDTVEEEGVFLATVELVRISDGQVVTRASAECGSPDELDRSGKPLWASRPRYARRSMAQTRATGKACRLAFSWVMALAGYEPTPAEEMPDQEEHHEPRRAAKPAPASTKRVEAPEFANQMQREHIAELLRSPYLTEAQAEAGQAALANKALGAKGAATWIARASAAIEASERQEQEGAIDTEARSPGEEARC
jgi:hypothetical protein